jgi:serine phosphatase RsbU (regulator of sigma subunit)
MAVPLQTERDVIGLVYVDTASLEREFRHDDLNLLTVLANVAAIRIEQERLAAVERREQIMDRDLRQAAEIQANLLPSVPPEVEGLELAGYNAACRTVGGDYYDFLEYGEGKIGVVLGDVAGKGLPASLMMTGLQARVRMLAEKPGDLCELMSSLDRGVADGCPANRFVSLVLCNVDARSGEMEYCNAGHNPPILVRGDGSVELLPSSGTVLGILPDIGYRAGRIRFEPGDLLALYSDGVTEAVDASDEEFGEERLIVLLRSLRGMTAAEVVGEVNEKLDEWTAGTPPHDDLTLVAVRRT